MYMNNSNNINNNVNNSYDLYINYAVEEGSDLDDSSDSEQNHWRQ